MNDQQTPCRTRGVSEPVCLRIESLSCRRATRPLLDNVTFTVSGGEAVHLTGPNGLGKTTLLRSLIGLVPFQQGQLGWGLPSVAITAEALARHSLMMPPTSVAAGSQSVAAAVTHLLRIHDLPAGPAVMAHALHQAGLAALGDLAVHRLSNGQARRLYVALLAAACHSRRRLWLLDEPTVSLDSEGRRRLATAVDSHRQTGGAVVVVSHDDPPFAISHTIDLRDFAAAGAAS